MGTEQQELEIQVRDLQFTNLKGTYTVLNLEIARKFIQPVEIADEPTRSLDTEPVRAF